MKVRKKPIVVEAFRITEETRTDNRDWPNWLHDAWQKPEGEMGAVYPLYQMSKGGPLLIRTLEGVMACAIGDWIIQGVKGELYPCKAEIFDLSYEAAE